MKKINQIEISGRKFYFEENALATLEKYIARIKELYRDNGEELKVADVENRIAEICHEKAGEKGIIDGTMIEETIESIGLQVEPTKQEAQTATEEAKDESQEPWHRAMLLGNKTFRDKHAGYLGGVLAGLAAYFGTNVALLRILAVLLFIIEPVGSIILLAYIALWIITPKATSIIDHTRARRVSTKGDEESTKAAWKANYERSMQELVTPQNNGCLPTLVKVIFYLMIGLPIFLFAILLLWATIIPISFLQLFAQGGFIGSIITPPIILMFGAFILAGAIILFALIHLILKKIRVCKPMKRWGKITLIALFVASLLVAGAATHHTVMSYGGYKNITQIFEHLASFDKKGDSTFSLLRFGNYTRTLGEHYNTHPLTTTDDKVFASIWDTSLQACNIPFVIEAVHNDKGEYKIYFYKHNGPVKEIEHKVVNKEYDACYTVNCDVIHGSLFFVWDGGNNTLYIDEEQEKELYGTRNSRYIKVQDNINISYIKAGEGINYGNAAEKGLQPFNIFFYGTQRTPTLLAGGLEVRENSTYTRIKGLNIPVRATTIDQSGQKDTVNLETHITIDHDKMQKALDDVKKLGTTTDSIIQNVQKAVNIDYTTAQ